MRTMKVALAAATLFGCGPGAIGKAALPDQPTAADATGRTSIKAVEGPATPLIVDWKAEQRADLEEVIHEGVAIVAWKDDGLRLLKRCRVKGEYGYLPIQTKKDVVRLETAEDVAANLPLGGVGIAGKIGAEFEQGTTLDIAMAMVGKRRTTWNDVAKDDLQGDCADATHYVRAILVGAFAMQTGTKAKVRAAAEIFGAGVSGGSEAAKGVDTSDGKLDDCDKASGEESKPPGQCQALLRLELEPIVAEAPKAAKVDAPGKVSEKAEVEEERAVDCGPGRVFAGGKCTSAKTDLPRVCSPSDPDDCAKQCDKGNARSCNTMGVLLSTGKKGPPDRAKANTFFDKACKAGLGSACTNLGTQMLGGNKQEAMKLIELGCANGDPRGCAIAGDAHYVGKDFAKAVRMYEKGCNGGNFIACTQAGFLYSGATEAVPRDDLKSLAFSRRACHGGNAVACGNAGLKYEFGMGVPKDTKLAVSLFERACKLDKSDCFRLGILYQQGEGVSKDEKKAQELYAASCKDPSGGLSRLFCHLNKALYGSASGGGSKQDFASVVTMMKGQCDNKVARACTFAGAAEHGMGNKGPAAAYLRQGCGMKDTWACDLQKRLR